MMRGCMQWKFSGFCGKGLKMGFGLQELRRKEAPRRVFLAILGLAILARLGLRTTEQGIEGTGWTRRSRTDQGIEGTGCRVSGFTQKAGDY